MGCSPWDCMWCWLQTVVTALVETGKKEGPQQMCTDVPVAHDQISNLRFCCPDQFPLKLTQVSIDLHWSNVHYKPTVFPLAHRLGRVSRSPCWIDMAAFYPQWFLKHLIVVFLKNEILQVNLPTPSKILLTVLLPSFSFWFFLHEPHSIPWTKIMLLRKTTFKWCI